mgnify:CR=1 FL=1
MKKINLLLAGIIGGLSIASANAAVVLKVHHFLPAASNAHKNIIQPWCDKVAKESKNEITCQIYPAMQLGGTPPQLVDQVRDGVVDLVWVIPTYAAGRFTKSEVFELPFLTSSSKQGSQALWEYVQKNALDEFKGIKPIFMHTAEGYVLHSNKQVKTLEDLKGMKIRSATRINAKLIASLGGTPVQMPLPQVSDSLSKGVIDAAMVPWEGVPATKIHEIAKYHLDAPKGSPRFSNSIFLFGMNQGTYDKLPANLKKVIDNNSGIKTSAWAGEVGFDSIVEPFSKMARDHGNTISTLPPAELERWVKASENVDDDWVKEVSAKGADGKKLLEDARALLKKYAK